jgi:hypothetical protein
VCPCGGVVCVCRCYVSCNINIDIYSDGEMVCDAHLYLQRITGQENIGTTSICMPIQLSTFQRDLTTNVTVNNWRKVTDGMPVKMKDSILTFVYIFYGALSIWTIPEVVGRTNRPL